MQQGIGMTQVFPQKAYRLEKEEKSKWEFQHSGINTKKEKLSIGKAYNSLCASSENN